MEQKCLRGIQHGKPDVYLWCGTGFRFSLYSTEKVLIATQLDNPPLPCLVSSTVPQPSKPPPPLHTPI